MSSCRMICIGSPYICAALQFRRKRQQRDVSRSLDGHTEPALVFGASARDAPRQHLPAFLHEGLQHFDFLVVDEVHLLDAEAANLRLTTGLPRASTRSTSASGGPP